jgi:nitrite reductase/ring-hydroxylating ferredoxin subunit
LSVRERTTRFPASDLPAGSRKLVEIGRQSVVVFNVDGELFAVLNRCPHQGAALAEGVVGATNMPAAHPGEYRRSPSRTVLRCPWHHFEYELSTGRCLADPDRFRVRTYVVAAEDGEIVVSLDRD